MGDLENRKKNLKTKWKLYNQEKMGEEVNGAENEHWVARRRREEVTGIENERISKE